MVDKKDVKSVRSQPFLSSCRRLKVAQCGTCESSILQENEAVIGTTSKAEGDARFKQEDCGGHVDAKRIKLI